MAAYIYYDSKGNKKTLNFDSAAEASDYAEQRGYTTTKGGTSSVSSKSSNTNTGTAAQEAQIAELKKQIADTQAKIAAKNNITPQQQVSNIQSQLADLQAQQAALTKYNLKDTNQLTQDASGNYVKKSITGNDQLDEMLDKYQSFIDTSMANGNVVNPAVKITPKMLQQFLNEATQEIDPYYQNLYNSIKDDISANIKSLQEFYDLSKQQEQESFKQELAGQQESMAGAGLAFSGVRGGKEKQLQETEATTLNKMAQAAASNAGDVLRAGESKIGTRNLSDLGITPEFAGSGTSYNYYNPTENVTGSLERERKTAIYNRRNERESAAREGRTLDLYKY